jgi:hypothetical protein
MISARSLTISISLAVLSAAPLICAQEAKPSEVGMILPLPLVIRQLELQPQRSLDFLLQAVPVSAPLIHAQDLSSYREFQFGMSLLAVAKQVNLQPSEAKVIHQRPAVIEELAWWSQRSLASSPQADPVKEILFSFYNGKLFRMLVTYDRYKTEGLTDQDMIEAISAKYGTGVRPAAKIILFSSSHVYNDSEKVIARWEDSQYSFNLFRSSYQPNFGMLVFSKRLDKLAQGAIVEAIRLDAQEAPQREIERQEKQAEENRATEEKVRPANKANFRP